MLHLNVLPKCVRQHMCPLVVYGVVVRWPQCQPQQLDAVLMLKPSTQLLLLQQFAQPVVATDGVHLQRKPAHWVSLLPVEPESGSISDTRLDGLSIVIVSALPVVTDAHD